MRGYVSGVNWLEIEPMKYWSFPASTSDAVKKQTVHNAIFSGEYIGSLKVDGYYQRAIKDEDGNCFMIARSRNVKGEIVDKIDWAPQLKLFLEGVPNGTVFLTEAYLPNAEGSKNVTSILGCLRDKAIERQKKTPLHFHIFDVMAFEGTNFIQTPYEERAQKLLEIRDAVPLNRFIHFTEFFEGPELWEQLQTYLAAGREGMVIMRKDAIVYQKRTPARVSIKVKKELEDTIDCFFTGRWIASTKLHSGKVEQLPDWEYWYNERTGERLEGLHYNEYVSGSPIVPITKGYFYDWAGSLEIGVFNASGKVEPIGYLSNLTEEIKQNPEAYAMKPIEVTAMELAFNDGIPALRHGKLLRFRDDISLQDCTLSKIVENH